MRVSASLLSHYMKCPLSAKFRYVDKAPVEGENAKAVFGKTIHHALEVYNQNGDLDEALEVFEKLWLDPDPLGIDSTKLVWPKFTTFGGLMESGREALKSYAEQQKWENRRVIATEHEFSVPLGEHELYGFVDLLEVKKSARGKKTLRVVDYKTNGRAPNKAELFLNVQFTCYHYASQQPEFWEGMPNGKDLFEEFEESPRRVIWYGLLQKKEYDAGPRDDKDFMRLYRVVRGIERAIEQEVFIPIVSSNSCGLCDYTAICPLEIPHRDELVRDDEDDAWF